MEQEKNKENETFINKLVIGSIIIGVIMIIIVLAISMNSTNETREKAQHTLTSEEKEISKLVASIKSGLNDPNSLTIYDITTYYKSYKDTEFLYVFLDYGRKNEYGGMVRRKAVYDYKGNCIGTNTSTGEQKESYDKFIKDVANCEIPLYIKKSVDTKKILDNLK